jgi:phytol kinase
VQDGWLAVSWLAVLAAGFALCVGLRAMGTPRTSVRDLLHVGAGFWPLGWPLWKSAAVPIAVAAAGFAATLAVPLAARRFRTAARLRDSVSGLDEQWSGLVLYAASAAVLTCAGMLADPFAAAAGLLALALGDGVGGAVGRRFGRWRFVIPFAKAKTLEGSAAVAVFAALGVAAAAARFDAHVTFPWILAAAAAAAVAEALSPRATDNVFVPAAVWALLSARV